MNSFLHPVYRAASFCVLAIAPFSFPILAEGQPKGKPLKETRRAAGPAKPGVKTPGVQIPMANLKSEAEIAVEGAPESLAFTDSVLVLTGGKNSIQKIDAKTNKLGEPIGGLDKPCGGVLSAFGALFVPNCGKGTLERLNAKTGKPVASIGTGTGTALPALASTADSLWILSDNKTTLTRIDGKENTIVGEFRLSPGCNSVLSAADALWVTCPADNRIVRIDPRTHLPVTRVEVPAQPVSVAFGEGSIWALCRTEGKVVKIDPKTNKVTATIELGIPDADGNIAFGEGSVWVSTAGFPITRIHPANEKVMQQFTGAGAGWIQTGLTSLWIVQKDKGLVTRFDPRRIAATLAE